MKKYIFIAILACIAIILSGCKLNINEEVLDNISDIRYNLFEGKTNTLTANIMCGMRENPYHYDGISNPKCEFGIITVVFKEKVDINGVNFKLKINNAEQTGILEQNPYDHSYMIDIGKIISNDATVYLSLENFSNDILMNCVSLNWNIQYDDALNIALENLQTDFPNYFVKKKFSAECYLKIVFDTKTNISPFYWYFGIIKTDGQTQSILIDTSTGEIVAKS